MQGGLGLQMWGGEIKVHEEGADHCVGHLPVRTGGGGGPEGTLGYRPGSVGWGTTNQKVNKIKM